MIEVVPDEIPYRLQEEKERLVSNFHSSSNDCVPVWK